MRLPIPPRCDPLLLRNGALSRVHVDEPRLLGPLAGPDGEGRPGDGLLVELLIDQGRIASITPAGIRNDFSGAAVDLDRGMVWPCFADLHTHLDKAQIVSRAAAGDGSLEGGIAASRQDRAERWSAQDLRLRMDFSLRCAFAHGTSMIRTHLDSEGDQDALSWAVFREIRADWRGRIALQAASLVPIDDLADADRSARLADRVAAADGVLGAFLYPTPALEPLLDRLFALAESRGLALDFHVDESGDSGANGLRAIAETALRRRFVGPIVAGHCCSLARQSDDEADRTLDLVAAAGIGVVSLPLTNLHLQDRRSGRTPRWRGVTLLHEMASRGIPVALASDNVRDPFFAYGDHDLLEVWRIATLVAHLDYPTGAWPSAITTTPASLMHCPGGGALRCGGPADLVLFSARTISELLARPQSDAIILRSGRPIDRTPPDFRILDLLMETS